MVTNKTKRSRQVRPSWFRKIVFYFTYLPVSDRPLTQYSTVLTHFDHIFGLLGDKDRCDSCQTSSPKTSINTHNQAALPACPVVAFGFACLLSRPSLPLFSTLWHPSEGLGAIEEYTEERRRRAGHGDSDGSSEGGWARLSIVIRRCGVETGASLVGSDDADDCTRGNESGWQ